MERYLRRIIGLYPASVEAEQARDLIVETGIEPRQISVLMAGSNGTGAHSASDSDDVPKPTHRSARSAGERANGNCGHALTRFSADRLGQAGIRRNCPMFSQLASSTHRMIAVTVLQVITVRAKPVRLWRTGEAPQAEAYYSPTRQ
jgi:hypothetical protein